MVSLSLTKYLCSCFGARSSRDRKWKRAAPGWVSSDEDETGSLLPHTFSPKRRSADREHRRQRRLKKHSRSGRDRRPTRPRRSSDPTHDNIPPDATDDEAMATFERAATLILSLYRRKGRSGRHRRSLPIRWMRRGHAHPRHPEQHSAERAQNVSRAQEGEGDEDAYRDSHNRRISTVAKRQWNTILRKVSGARLGRDRHYEERKSRETLRRLAELYEEEPALVYMLLPQLFVICTTNSCKSYNEHAITDFLLRATSLSTFFALRMLFLFNSSLETLPLDNVSVGVFAAAMRDKEEKRSQHEEATVLAAPRPQQSHAAVAPIEVDSPSSGDLDMEEREAARGAEVNSCMPFLPSWKRPVSLKRSRWPTSDGASIPAEALAIVENSVLGREFAGMLSFIDDASVAAAAQSPLVRWAKEFHDPIDAVPSTVLLNGGSRSRAGSFDGALRLEALSDRAVSQSCSQAWGQSRSLTDTEAPASFSRHSRTKRLQAKSSATSLRKCIDTVTSPSSSSIAYFHRQGRFLQRLVDVAEKLRQTAMEERKGMLDKELRHINADLLGEDLPPFLSSNSPVCSIVRIPEGEARVFSTHKRAPYLMCYETIRLDVSMALTSAEAIFEQLEAVRHKIVEAQTSSGSLDEDEEEHGSAARQQRQQEMSSSVLWGGEGWEAKTNRLRSRSPFGAIPGWELHSVVVKEHDDLRQEMFAMQLLSVCAEIFKREDAGQWLKTYGIVSISSTAGFIEGINDARSIHDAKETVLKAVTEQRFNSQDLSRAGLPPDNPEDWVRGRGPSLLRILADGADSEAEVFRRRINFAASLATYCIVCYVFHIKDRHNGNIMLDKDGHLIHIDFGFFLSRRNTPGQISFEKAPFKLTDEALEVIGREEGHPVYDVFLDTAVKAFLHLHRNAKILVRMVEVTMRGFPTLPCFAGGEEVLDELVERLLLHSDSACDDWEEENSTKRWARENLLRTKTPKGLTTAAAKEHVQKLIHQSKGNWFTKKYDYYQFLTNGILI